MQTKSVETLMEEKFQHICNEFKYEKEATLAFYEWAGYLSALVETKQIDCDQLIRQLRRLQNIVNK